LKAKAAQAGKIVGRAFRAEPKLTRNLGRVDRKRSFSASRRSGGFPRVQFACGLENRIELSLEPLGGFAVLGCDRFFRQRHLAELFGDGEIVDLHGGLAAIVALLALGHELVQKGCKIATCRCHRDRLLGRA
jgi:hypothetical protein